MTEGLATFFGALGNIARVAADAQRRLDRELATNFSATKLLQPKEILLSDIIACLFDPAEVHGQGSRFLDLFIKTFEVPCDVTDNTRCRVAREQGHLDVLVEIGWSKPFAIGIENKPWAGDRRNQIRDYCDYLEKYFSGRWWFGYLSGSGTPPPEHSLKAATREEFEQNGRFRTIPFVRSDRVNDYSIQDWFTRCSEACIAERVRWFLRDLSDYIEPNFANTEGEIES